MARVLPFAVCVLALSAGPLAAQNKDSAPALAAAHGVVEKADKTTLAIKPRAANGRFEKSVALTLTGTTRVTVLTPQTRGDGKVLTQREVTAADLTEGQEVAVIYAPAGGGPVALAVVAQPIPAK